MHATDYLSTNCRTRRRVRSTSAFVTIDGGRVRQVQGGDVRLRPSRIEDVPIPELSGLALDGSAGGPPQLLAIGDRKSLLARALLTDAPLEWSELDLGHAGVARGRAQLEGVAVAGDGTILVLREDPPMVLVLDPAGDRAESTRLLAGERGVVSEVLDESSSSGEGLLPLRDGRLLIAKEKSPPLLVEFGPPDADPSGVAVDSFPTAGERLDAAGDRLQALAAWRLDGVDDISDVACAGGHLYCLSDQSRRVVVVDLPLTPGSERARVGERCDLEVPERRGEPDGKPEGLVVMADGTLVVGLDTETASANLCWFQP
jgi:uncharacterized protein YjiK